jgi:hypothetical protein
MGDPPRKFVKRMLRFTVKPGASVSYLACYDMNRSTDRMREAFMGRAKAAMDAF